MHKSNLWGSGSNFLERELTEWKEKMDVRVPGGLYSTYVMYMYVRMIIVH